MQVITYAADDGGEVNLTRRQIARLEKAGVWPRSPTGREFCRVSHGLHEGDPTYTDEEIAGMIA